MTLIDFDSIHERGIYTDLMREFIKNGHRVYIISPSSKSQPTKLYDYKTHTILKLRITDVQKTNPIKKGIATLLLESQYIRAIKAYFSDVTFDLVIYSTPPITLQRAVAYVKRRDHAKAYLLLKDIFPQNAVDLGMMQKSGIRGLIYWYFRAKEKKLYANSDTIGCMSQANVDYVLDNNPAISPDVVEICPNSIEPLDMDQNSQQLKAVKKKFHIPLNKTAFIYGGNLGVPQGVDFLMECLVATRYDHQAFFVIVGAGTEFDKLQSFMDRQKLNHAILYPQLPKDEYDVLVNACDVGLIFLDNRFTVPNFPSRMLSYMEASIPVLAATDGCTDIREVITHGGFGLWCESGNVAGFKQKLKQLHDERLREQMGQCARAYIEKNCTVKHAYEIIMKHYQ